MQEAENELSLLEEPVRKTEASINELAKQDKDCPVTMSLVGKMKKLNSLVAFVRKANDERKTSLQEGLDACKQFWPGLEQLRDTLADVQGKIEVQGEPHYEPRAIEELQKQHEVSRLSLKNFRNFVCFDLLLKVF